MGELALAIVLLGTVYFAIHYRGFRRGLIFTLLGVFVLAAVSGVVVWFYSQQEAQRRKIARTLIKSDQLEITDATLSIGTSAEMKALVTNRSPYPLKELTLEVTVIDCPTNFFDRSDSSPLSPVKKGEEQPEKKDRKCTAVGQSVVREYWIGSIPSGQKRTFSGHARFDNLPPLKSNEWTWHYSIAEIVADRE